MSKKPLCPPSTQDFLATVRLAGARIDYFPSHLCYCIAMPVAQGRGMWKAIHVQDCDLLEEWSKTYVLDFVQKCLQEAQSG